MTINTQVRSFHSAKSPSLRSSAERMPQLYDMFIIAITLILIGVSLVMVYSTTGVTASEKFGDTFFYVKRQAMSCLIGLVLMLLLSRVDINIVKRCSPFFLPICVLLLLCTLIPGIGDSAGGAKRWVSLGFVRFQPGELVKVLFIVFIAGFLDRHEARLPSLQQGIIKPFLLVCLVSGLFLAQPDFGSAVVVASISFCMVAASGVRLRYLLIAGGILAFSAICLVLISPYRMKRIASFLSPFSDVSGKGYQLIQSLIAVGTGQTTGVGLGASQQKLFFLPAAHTDFIFSVVAEELGFIGAVMLLSLFLLFLWRGLMISSRLAEDVFASSLALGFTLLISLPALLNIGVVTGMLPTKGLVLPLIGYGGTSLVTCMAAIGVLLSLSRRVHLRDS
jgi:cell division protein FtsW